MVKSHKHTIIVGLQHGDEGKGKFVDYYTSKKNIKHVVRFNGGPNAGHTVYIDGKKFVTHLIPTGILTEGVNCYIGPGCVLNPVKLMQEIQELTEMGVKNIKERLFIDGNCNFILQKHIEKDIADEAVKPVGSTKQGMAPCYADKYGRNGVNFGNWTKSNLTSVEQVSILNLLENAQICEVGHVLRELPPNTEILYEGAQGTMLDIDSLDYPNVTSSHCTAPFAMIGSGYGFMKNVQVYGVAKSYLTKVGTGAFPSSIENTPLAEKIRAIGKEYGATTGRPRKIGWLNLYELQHAIQVNGVNKLVLLKNDVLVDSKSEINIHTDDGNINFGVFESIDSFSFSSFLDYIEVNTGCVVEYLGTGPNREDLKEIE